MLQNPHRELTTEHRGDLRQPARPVGESIDPCDQQVLERGRKEEGWFQRGRPRPVLPLQAPCFEQRPQQLLEVERITVGARDDPLPCRLVESAREQGGEDLDRSRGRKRVEPDLGRAVRELGEHARAETPALRARIPPKRSDEEERGPVGELEKVLRQLARRGMCPVQVFERKHERSLSRERLDPCDVGTAHVIWALGHVRSKLDLQ